MNEEKKDIKKKKKKKKSNPKVVEKKKKNGKSFLSQKFSFPVKKFKLFLPSICKSNSHTFD